MSRFHSFSLAVSHGGASLLDFLSAQGKYRTAQLACVNLVDSYLLVPSASQLDLAMGRGNPMTSQAKHFSSSRAARLVQLVDSCGAAAVPPGAAPKISAARIRQCAVFLLCLALLAVFVACSNDTRAASTKQEITVDPNLLTVDQPERFPTVKVESRDLPTELHANGTIQPDVSKTIHVTSLGSGRVVDLKVRLGDYVNKGQELLAISSPDVAGALGDYHKASADEELARKALDRAQLLYSHGAFAQKDLEAAENAAAKAKSDRQTAENRLRVIGGDPAHPSNLIELRAPVAGTIVEQNVAGF